MKCTNSAIRLDSKAVSFRFKANNIHMANMPHTPQPPTKRALRREARIEQLLAHAMRIVSDEGREALTIARLADEADAAVGALYRYFKGKNELLAMLQTRATLLYGEFLSDRLQGLPPATDAESSLRRVLELFDSWIVFSSEHPKLHALMDESMSQLRPTLDDARVEQLAGKVAPMFAASVRILDEAVQCGALPAGLNDTRITTLAALMHGFDHLRRTHEHMGSESWESARREGVKALLLGWGVSAELLNTASNR